MPVPARPQPAPRRAVQRFVDAVQALALDPAANVERYLAASRALESARRPVPVRSSRR